MENTQAQPTATAMMRFTKINFDRVIPAHILQAINASYADSVISTCPVVKLAVGFHQSGEPYVVTFRLNGYTLGTYMPESGFGQGAFMNLPVEVVAYLSQAADEAFAIVHPIVTVH